MWGDKMVPQIKVLQMVDLIISHGGNNTLIEAFYYGTPKIIMPLFADQFDNAQRIVEKGFGMRLDPYCSKDELINAIDKMVSDNELKERMNKVSMRIQRDANNDKLAQLIESVILKF